MIRYLKGKLVNKTPTRLLLDVNGIGYDILVTINCSRHIGMVNDEIKILTYLYVREDNLQLFGFMSENERDLFLHLISTPGIGPKKAIAILSGSTVNDLQRYIIEENLIALTALPGVGKKTAQRLIVDLKEKLVPVYQVEQVLPSGLVQKQKDLIEEATLALISLGYNQISARKAIQAVIEQASDKINLEDLIKNALRKV